MKITKDNYAFFGDVVTIETEKQAALTGAFSFSDSPEGILYWGGFAIRDGGEICA